MVKFVLFALMGAVAYGLIEDYTSPYYSSVEQPLGKNKYPGNDTYHDIIEIPDFIDLIEDPDQIQVLMEEQGVTDIDYVEVTGPMSGSTTEDNYKGYIHWTDGTETKVVLKGISADIPTNNKFREAMYYSRMADTLEPTITVPQHYLAVMNPSTKDSFVVEQFMTGYTSLRDWVHEDRESNLETGLIQATDLLAKFHAIGWMDTDLGNENNFYLKTYGWLDGAHINPVTKSKKTALWGFAAGQWEDWKTGMDNGTAIAMGDELRAAVDRVYDLWDWDTMVEQMNQPDYMWGNVHGDFHFGQIMVQGDDLDDIETVLLDWEFSGYAATPGIDLAYMMMDECPDYIATYQESVLLNYYNRLLETGKVSQEDFNYEKLYADYRTFGFAHNTVLQTGNWAYSNQSQIIYALQSFYDYNNLTIDDMVQPMYGWWQ